MWIEHAIHSWRTTQNYAYIVRIKWICAASQNHQKPVSIERRLKSWNIKYIFKWNQPYLSHDSNSLNSASAVLNFWSDEYLVITVCFVTTSYKNVVFLFNWLLVLPVHTFKISFQLKDSSPLGNTHNTLIFKLPATIQHQT